jgi:hypothetical protein
MEFTMTVDEYYQKNAVLKREEGINRPRNPSHAYYHTNLAIEFSRDLFYVRGGQDMRIRWSRD